MNVDDYLNQAPEPHQSTLSELHSALRELLPEASEEISYGMPAFKVEGKAVAGYAHFKNHCSFFPHSGSVLPTLAEELDSYEWSKGTLKFPVDRSLPKDLVARLVAARLDEIGLSSG